MQKIGKFVENNKCYTKWSRKIYGFYDKKKLTSYCRHTIHEFYLEKLVKNLPEDKFKYCSL